MSSLYPPIEPYAIHMLPVSDLHTLYVEESGNPEGMPVLRIHGGPGSLGAGKEKFRQLFDPKKYRIIIFDQRWCRRSTPFGELKENTTDNLIEDIEKIRKFLNIEKWMVTGGSRGSTLSLYYTQQFPKSVQALLLNGLFLGTSDETNYLLNGWYKSFFPEQREQYKSFFPDKYSWTMREYVTDYILNADEYDYEFLKAIVIREWSGLKYLDATLNTDIIVSEKWIATLKIFFHYSKYDFFMEDKVLLRLENIEKIRHIPTVLLHGRYDLDCSVSNAWNLKKARPEMTLEIIEWAGHRTGEPKIQKRIVEWTDIFIESTLKHWKVIV